MEIKDELIGELLKDYQKPEGPIGENGLLKQLTRGLVERAPRSELTHHPGYCRNEAAAVTCSNRRNGSSRKTLKGDFGEFEVAVPRDRESAFAR